jgi:predicted DNA-binding protein (MmcQ/YjbR family)
MNKKIVNLNTFKKLALSFDSAVEQPHFNKSSYRINKKIFATLDLENKRVTLKLSPIDQSVFCAYDTSIIYPVSGTWGKQGWTIVELEKVPKSMLVDALTTSYHTVSAKK